MTKKNRLNQFTMLTALSLATFTLAGAFTLPAAKAESLEQALIAAYESNPTLRAARANLRAGDEAVPQALSGWRPLVTVNANTGGQYTDSDSGSSKNSDGTLPVGASLDIVQPLYTGGRTEANVNAAESDVQAQRSSLKSTEQQVLLDAVAAYINVWRANSVLELNLNNERVLQRQLEATRDRFSVGELTRTDVAQAESRLARAVSDRIEAEGALAEAAAVYEEVIGRSPSDTVQPPLPMNLPASMQSAVDIALASNPDVVAAEFQQRAAGHRVEAAEAEFEPEVNLVGRVSHDRNRTVDDSNTTQASVLAELTVPIYQQGFVSSQVRQQKQLSNQRRIEIEQARRRAQQEAVASWEALETARAQTTSFESEVEANRIALDGVQQENLVGARTVLDVLDAEQELLTSQVNLVTAQRDLVLAAYRTIAAMGSMTAQDLALDVTLYDPQANYDAVRNRSYGTDVQPIQ